MSDSSNILLVINLLISSGALTGILVVAYRSGKAVQRIEGHDKDIARHDREINNLWRDHGKLREKVSER